MTYRQEDLPAAVAGINAEIRDIQKRLGTVEKAGPRESLFTRLAPFVPWVSGIAGVGVLGACLLSVIDGCQQSALREQAATDQTCDRACSAIGLRRVGVQRYQYTVPIKNGGTATYSDMPFCVCGGRGFVVRFDDQFRRQEVLVSPVAGDAGRP